MSRRASTDELANEGLARRRVTTGDEACRRLDSLEGVA